VRLVLEAVGIRIGQQLLVIQKPGRHRRAGEGHHDHPLELVQRGELPVQGQQHVVDHQEAVLRIGGDPADLAGRQPQVQRVHDAAGGRDAEVALQVGVMVPAQRRHPVALVHPQRLQRGRQRSGAPVILAEAVPAQALVRQPRDDLVAGEQLPGALQQVVERQRDVHHRALHAGSWLARSLYVCPGPMPAESTLMDNVKTEIAATAARMVVEEGLEYGPAKRRAVRQLGLPARTALPDNDLVEDSVREYIELFCADTQPQELEALRRLAVTWMERLAVFRPYLGGAVWHGTATRLSDIYLQLFCDDPKSAEIALIDHNVDYEARTVTGFTGESVEALSLSSLSPELGETVGVHLLIYDHDDVRGALRADAKGRTPRGDLAAVRALLGQ
jgi:hypothetical protein